jgi:hypothetical protein
VAAPPGSPDCAKISYEDRDRSVKARKKSFVIGITLLDPGRVARGINFILRTYKDSLNLQSVVKQKRNSYAYHNRTLCLTWYFPGGFRNLFLLDIDHEQVVRNGWNSWTRG